MGVVEIVLAAMRRNSSRDAGDLLALCGNADEALVLAHRLWEHSIGYTIVDDVEVRVSGADLPRAREHLEGIWVKRPSIPKIPTARVVKRPATKP